MDLQALLLDFSSVADENLAAEGAAAYATHYLNKGKFGIHVCHDGDEVVFHGDRFNHGFYDKPDRWSLTKSTDLPDESRLERMRWIGPLLRGEVEGSECWHVPSPAGRRRPPNRLYIIWREAYVLWLEPRQAGGWKFSSAYVKRRGKIRDYCYGGSRIWAHPEREKSNA